MGELELRRRARELIRSGLLPPWRSDRIWGGPGSGATCILCGSSISEIEVEIEVELDMLTRAIAHFHIACLQAWESECDCAATTLRAACDLGRISARGSALSQGAGNE
jgi:hypothetical protein